MPLMWVRLSYFCLDCGSPRHFLAEKSPSHTCYALLNLMHRASSADLFFLLLFSGPCISRTSLAAMSAIASITEYKIFELERKPSRRSLRIGVSLVSSHRYSSYYSLRRAFVFRRVFHAPSAFTCNERSVAHSLCGSEVAT